MTRTRPTASLVILAWNNWAMTSACLDLLLPTVGVDDEVIVVDNGSTDGTGDGLKKYRWVKVVSNATNRGFAGGSNDGAAVATRDIVVFLNNDTMPVGGWLDALLAPFADPAIGASGPRSNFVSGPQIVEGSDYSRHRVTGLRAFEHRWALEHANLVTDCPRLVGFCLAVRRELIESVGAFDESFKIGGYEDDDLCRRIAAAGHRLVIAHGSFLHHHGHATFDANGLDWAAIEQQNRAVFVAKHSVPA